MSKNTGLVSVQKANLAKLLATENIKIEFKKTHTAAFNLKSRVLILPFFKESLSNSLYNLFIGHEVGHALLTSYEEWERLISNKIVSRTILNIVEDIRIEKYIKRKYPGIRTDFYNGYKELLDNNKFNIKYRNHAQLNFLDRLNVHAKCGEALIDMPFKPMEIAIRDKALNVETWEEVVEVSKEIYEFLKGNFEEEKVPSDDVNSSPGKGNSSENDDELDEEFDDEMGPPPDEMLEELRKNNNKKPKESKESKENDKEEPKSGSSGKSDEQDNEGKEFDEKELESLTQKALDKAIDSEISLSASIYNWYVPEKIDLKTVIFPWEKFLQKCKDVKILDSFLEKEQKKYTEVNKPVINFLFKEFDLKKRAKQFQKIQINKMGILDPTKLFSYKYNLDLFKRNAFVPDAKSHGLVFFIDWSGSMSDTIYQTLIQMMCITDFCRKSMIPFECYAFSDRNHKDLLDEKEGKNASKQRTFSEDNDGKICSMDRLCLWNILSSKMNIKDYNFVKNILLCATIKKERTGIKLEHIDPLFGLHGTPLNDAIVAAMEIVPKFKNDNNLQIVNTIFLTDGESNPLYSNNIGERRPEKNDKLVIHDRKTGHSILVKPGDELNYTNCLYEMLRNRTQANVIGFYILEKNVFQENYTKFNRNRRFDKDVLRKFSEDFYVSIENSGCNEYYMINTDSFITQLERETTIDGMIKNRINSLRSKTMLQRFIQLVA